MKMQHYEFIDTDTTDLMRKTGLWMVHSISRKFSVMLVYVHSSGLACMGVHVATFPVHWLS